MKRILSVLFTVLFILLFIYYLLFFRFFNISYTFESNKTFFKWLFEDPVTLILGLTPGTEINNTYLNLGTFQQESVFDTVVEGNVPVSTPITGDGGLVIADIPTWPEYLSFSDSDEVYSVFHTRMMSTRAPSDAQASSEEWNWETNMLIGDVVAKDSQKTILGLNVDFPEYLVEQGNPHTFKIGCTDETSVLVSTDNLEVLEYDTPFFEKVDIGDTVYAYCTSSDCIALGRGCILMGAKSE